MKLNNIFKSKSKLTKVLFVVGACMVALAIISVYHPVRYLLPVSIFGLSAFYIPYIILIIACILLLVSAVRHNKEIERETKIDRDNIFYSKSMLTRLLFISALVIFLVAGLIHIAEAIYQTELTWIVNLLMIISAGLVITSSVMYSKEREKPTDTWVVLMGMVMAFVMFNMS
jgi:cytochrome bd-type quinol oxidase subunit 2